MTQVKLGTRPVTVVTRKMQRKALFKAILGMITMISLVIFLYRWDPLPSHKSQLRRKRLIQKQKQLLQEQQQYPQQKLQPQQQQLPGGKNNPIQQVSLEQLNNNNNINNDNTQSQQRDNPSHQSGGAASTNNVVTKTDVSNSNNNNNNNNNNGNDNNSNPDQENVNNNNNKNNKEDTNGEEEEDDEEGRLISITISNLKDGKSGTIIIQTKPSWAPRGVERFHQLIDNKFYMNAKFFRVVPDFLVQFGIHEIPLQQDHKPKPFLDDNKVIATNSRGTIAFATGGPNTRSTQLFINTRQSGNSYLDKEGCTPFGKVISGMEYIDAIYDEYGEKPNQGKIQNRGNAYLDEEYPLMSYIAGIRILKDYQQNNDVKNET